MYGQSDTRSRRVEYSTSLKLFTATSDEVFVKLNGKHCSTKNEQHGNGRKRNIKRK